MLGPNLVCPGYVTLLAVSFIALYSFLKCTIAIAQGLVHVEFGNIHCYVMKISVTITQLPT